MTLARLAINSRSSQIHRKIIQVLIKLVECCDDNRVKNENILLISCIASKSIKFSELLKHILETCEFVVSPATLQAIQAALAIPPSTT
jgi:DNA polymerase II small subunit/DNA polymerase delta subunit B